MVPFFIQEGDVRFIVVSRIKQVEKSAVAVSCQKHSNFIDFWLFNHPNEWSVNLRGRCFWILSLTRGNFLYRIIELGIVLRIHSVKP